MGATVLWLSSCLRESAVNLVRSGSYTRQLRRDEAKGSEPPPTAAPSTYVSTYLKRYQLGGRAGRQAATGVWAVTAHLQTNTTQTSPEMNYCGCCGSNI